MGRPASKAFLAALRKSGKRVNEPKRVEVENCGVCPFGWDGTDMDDVWRCIAVDRGHDFKPIPNVHKIGVGWSPPPRWCPLRKQDHLVTLRTKETQ